MLSIGAMGKGQGAYYLSLAREDYYLEGGEPPGVWHGEGAKQLGLLGTVDGEALTRLMEGFHPTGRYALIQNAGQDHHQPGWDLTFSAPKSVSVLWSQADLETRQTIQEAHLAAVRASLDYLEQHSAFTRRGKGGGLREPAKLMIAAFEHGTSRAQDPQLHTHCLVMNACLRADGTSGTIESKPLYQTKMTAGAIYRAELAAQLEERLKLMVERHKNTFEITGVSKPLIVEFSKRRAEIEEKLAQTGYKSAQASAAATLSTREKKTYASRETLFHDWQEVGKTKGWGSEQAQRLIKEAKAPARDRECDMTEALLSATKQVSEQQSVFREREFIRAVAEECQGRGIHAYTLLSKSQAYLNEQEEIVRLGRLNGEPFYTTREMMQLEKELLNRVEQSRESKITGVSKRTIENALAIKPRLSDEQKRAVKHLTEEGSSIRVVSGMAGTGKTTMLSVARMTWELEGFEVRGAALAGNAAKKLSEGASIKCETLHRTLFDLESGRLTLHDKSILVIDEAGMVGTRQMKALVEATERAGARLVLVGDARQLQPIEAGGPFAEMERRLGAVSLTEIRRQKEAWAKEAVHDFAGGRAREGLRAFAERGLLTIAEDRKEACAALIAQWKERGVSAPEEQLIFTGTRHEAAILNRMAQEERAKAGRLGETSLSTSESNERFHVGDRLIFTRKSRLHGVENGSIGEVISIEPIKSKLTVRLDSGERIRFSLESYDHIKLGYAMTTHKGQGATVERAYILAGGMMQDREISYVQASRARQETRIYTDKAEAGDNLTQLVRQMSHSRQKEMAHEVQARASKQESFHTQEPTKSQARVQKIRF